MSDPFGRRATLIASSVAYLHIASPVRAQTAAGGHGPDPAVEVLLADVERIVDVQEAGGWILDRDEIEDMFPTVLESVCRVSPAARERAVERLRFEVTSNGDARTLYEEAGREWTSEATAAVARERQLAVLEAVVATSAADCPFWVHVEPEFAGRQTDADRITLSLETGGIVQARETEGAVTIGGGGGGRLLLGYGFGGSFSLLGGGEFGGSALVVPRSRNTSLKVNFFPAVPVVARFHDVSWHYDLEVAPVGLFQIDDGRLSYGVRGGAGIGFSGLRTRNILPWAGLGIAYEHYFESGGRPRAHFLRGGFRVGLVWDP